MGSMAVALPLAAPADRLRRRITKVLRDTVERGRRLSRIAKARAGYAGGLLATTVGVGVELGIGWALILGGLATSTSFLLLYDVDESP